MLECQKCGARYEETEEYHAFYFSSASMPVGSYTSPKQIATLNETMLTCPLDEGAAPEEYPTGATPAGGSMYTGDDRYTAGDETHPSKDEL